jgi:serine/threonine protein kinase
VTLDLEDRGKASFISEPFLMALASGTKLGDYEIRSLIGEGGMGEVYRTRDPKLGRDVAVKVLPGSYLSDVDWLKRFEQEAQATAKSF